jgi:sterol desaturase/sphingolipid hydroxylase (fatty acid hydroxylase superfamily)
MATHRTTANAKLNINHKVQGRIFKNDFLESLTKSSPRITIAFYSLMIISFWMFSYKFSQLNFWQTVGFYFGGIITWTLMEYILHRYVFHIDEYFPAMKRLHYMIHGVHHENPRDQQRLFMPPVPGTIIASLLFGFWFLILGSNAFAFMAGITNGYLLYSYIHFTVHTKPSKLFFHKLWVHHLKHHYKYPDKAYGVSSPIWDIIFKTMPPENPNETRHFS